MTPGTATRPGALMMRPLRGSTKTRPLTKDQQRRLKDQQMTFWLHDGSQLPHRLQSWIPALPFVKSHSS